MAVDLVDVAADVRVGGHGLPGERGARDAVERGYLEGELVESSADAVVLDHPVLGILSIGRADLAEGSPPPTAAEAPAVDPRASWLERAADRILGDAEGWERSIEFGLTGSEGNTVTRDVVAAIDAASEDDARRWKLEARYFRTTADRETTRSQGRARILRDWLIPGRRHFAFAEARYDYDQFEAFDHRVSLGAGPGVDLVDRPKLALRGRSGLFLTRTFGSPGRDRIDPEASFGAELEWRPNERNDFELANTVRFSLREPGDLRNLTRVSWKTRISEEAGLSFKLGLENEWESEVLEDERANDLTYYGSLVVDF